MKDKILNEKEIKLFGKLTGIKAAKIIISKTEKYYYATIIDNELKVRIRKELALKFI